MIAMRLKNLKITKKEMVASAYWTKNPIKCKKIK